MNYYLMISDNPDTYETPRMHLSDDPSRTLCRKVNEGPLLKVGEIDVKYISKWRKLFDVSYKKKQPVFFCRRCLEYTKE